MASTAIPDSEITEYRDSHEELFEKTKQLAQYVREAAGQFVVYTGAGISTNAGIPDFRGPQGVWTLKAKGKTPSSRVTLDQARPTLTHMALVSLNRAGFLSYLVSQNCDGLHLRSGFPPESLSELHGNCNTEACPDCGEIYWRPERSRTAPNEYCLTGRDCRVSGCGGQLRYTTVAFGQSMPDLALERAELHSRTAKLSLTLGTSMRVQPACELPGLAKKISRGKNGKLCIVNFQKTPYDSKCDVRIYGDCDEVMTMLCQHLKVPILPMEDLFDEKDQTKLKTWYAGFKKNWVFRRPDQTYSWCAPKPQKPKTKHAIPIPESIVPNEDAGGYVDPKRDCPHVGGITSDTLPLDAASKLFTDATCQGCSGRNELWLCLTCLKCHCGRYQRGDALRHFEQSKSLPDDGEKCCTAMSLGDLNVWCYECNAYIEAEETTAHYIVMHWGKFGTLPPGYQFKTK